MGRPDTFVFRSLFPCSAADLYAWHSRAGALERLIPPWEKTTVVSRLGGIAPGGRVEMQMHLGPVPYRWKALHVEDEPGVMFRDIQQKGPFSSWSHSHHFSDTDEGALLEDRIEFRLPAHSFLPDFVKSRVHRILQRTFHYRHATLREDLLLHRNYSRTPLRILVTGASGVLGRALLPFLTTGGHRVWTLVRRRPDPDKQEIQWDPMAGTIDRQALPELDAVIHLAGEYIGLNRWTAEKKQRVIDSRVQGTNLLVRTLAAMPVPPKVFLSASAVGYYGNSGEHLIDEKINSRSRLYLRGLRSLGKGRDTCRDRRNPNGSDADRSGLDPEGRRAAAAACNRSLRLFPSFRQRQATCELDRYRRYHQCHAALPELPRPQRTGEFSRTRTGHQCRADADPLGGFTSPAASAPACPGFTDNLWTDGLGDTIIRLRCFVRKTHGLGFPFSALRSRGAIAPTAGQGVVIPFPYGQRGARKR